MRIDPHFELAQENRDRAAARFGSDLAVQRNAHAVELASQDHIEQAIDALYEALKVDPQSVAAHNNLGIILAGQGRGEEALVHYRHALRLEPQAASTHVNVGLLLTRLGDFQQAEHHILQAIQLNPELPQPYNALGLLFSARGNTKRAIGCYRRAPNKDPGYGEARRNLERELGVSRKDTP